MKAGVVLCAALGLLLMFSSSRAAELVTNGGFESGYFSGWQVIPAASGTDVFINPVYPHTGDYAAGFAATRTLDDSIAQTLLSMVSDQSYTISFWLAHPSGVSSNDFSPSWGATELFSLTNIGYFDYTHYTFTQTASASSTVLQFSGRERPAYFYLDDVSVTGPQDVAVPEPATVLLLGSALLGLGGFRRKAKK